MSDLAGAVTLQARGATKERLEALGRVEQLNGAFRIYPKDKAKAAQLAQEVVEMVNLHGWKVEGMAMKCIDQIAPPPSACPSSAGWRN